MRVRVDQIVVGERRREDFGDVDALAASIERYGLLHPIVIDTELHLIAGERRLRAVAQLGWREVDARPLGSLSEAERREIELEENLRRKDLTAYEQAKFTVELADAARAVIAEVEPGVSSHAETKLPGRPTSPISLRSVEERTGLSRAKIHRAEAQVQAADSFPVMRSWNQHQVLEAKEILEELPAEQRQPAVALVTQPGVPPNNAISTLRNLAEMETNERTRIFDLAESTDSRDRTAALTEAAKAPPMPDPRLELLDDAKELVRQALRMFRVDPANDAIAAILPPFEAAYAAIEEHGRGSRNAA